MYVDIYENVEQTSLSQMVPKIRLFSFSIFQALFSIDVRQDFQCVLEKNKSYLRIYYT